MDTISSLAGMNALCPSPISRVLYLDFSSTDPDVQINIFGVLGSMLLQSNSVSDFSETLYTPNSLYSFT